MNASPRGLNRKHLRVEELRQLAQLGFANRRAIEGRWAGKHRTRQRGRSLEFHDYREYVPGDDPGDVDWRIFARSDKLFLRTYEHQSDLAVHLLIDASASMAYAGLDGQESKFDRAARLAASIAFLTMNQQDRAGFAIAQSGFGKSPGGLSYTAPATSALPHLAATLHVLEKTRPAGKANLVEAVRSYAERMPRRDVLIVFSDLLDERDELLKTLAAIRAYGREIVIFHVLHPDELDLPDVDRATFIDSETLDAVQTSVADLRAAYRKTIDEFLHAWRTGCAARSLDYQLASLAEPPLSALERHLVRRASRFGGGR